MRLASTTSCYLLGILFTVLGLNGLFRFLPEPLIPAGLAGQLHVAMAWMGRSQMREVQI